MKIGNVIHESDFVNHTKVDYINYINEPKSYDDINRELPTLYVGWNFMKSCNPNNDVIQNADILKKKIVTNELYWEFDFRESKASHVKGVTKFVNHAPEFYFAPKYNYINLDPVFFQIKDIDDLMDVLAKEFVKIYQYRDEMLYILTSDKITGINLKMYDFFQFDIDNMVRRLTDRLITEDMYFTDPDGEIYQSYYKIFPDFERLRRYLVSIVSK
jgi:hypothetical protein